MIRDIRTCQVQLSSKLGGITRRAEKAQKNPRASSVCHGTANAIHYVNT